MKLLMRYRYSSFHTNSMQSSMYLVLTAHLNSEEPCFYRLIATCGSWLPYWMVQIYSIYKIIVNLITTITSLDFLNIFCSKNFIK